MIGTKVECGGGRFEQSWMGRETLNKGGLGGRLWTMVDWEGDFEQRWIGRETLNKQNTKTLDNKLYSAFAMAIHDKIYFMMKQVRTFSFQKYSASY